MRNVVINSLTEIAGGYVTVMRVVA